MTCSTYTGEVENGLRQGQGMYWCALTGATYTGQWVAGRREGQGRLDYSGNGESYYDGDWVDNQQKGVGIRRYRYNDYLWNGRVGYVTLIFCFIHLLAVDQAMCTRGSGTAMNVMGRALCIGTTGESATLDSGQRASSRDVGSTCG